MEVNYKNTYWSHKGKHETLKYELQPLIPVAGAVPNAENNPALEKFRVASNCYYDLYNNGLYNRAAEFRKVFGFSAVKLMNRSRALTQEVIDRTEKGMDEIILAAYAEQTCETTIATDGTQWGHFIGDKFKPCGKFHPGTNAQSVAKRLSGKVA